MDESKKSEEGYVYILTNPYYKENCIKIGKTSRGVSDRIKELDTTSVPEEFEIYGTIKCKNYSEIETLVHEYFKEDRVRYCREFFIVDPEQVLDLFCRLAKISENKEIEVVKYEKGEPHCRLYPNRSIIKKLVERGTNNTYQGERAINLINEFGLNHWPTRYGSYENGYRVDTKTTMAILFGDRRTAERDKGTITITDMELIDGEKRCESFEQIIDSLSYSLSGLRYESVAKAFYNLTTYDKTFKDQFSEITIEEYCKQVEIISKRKHWGPEDRPTTKQWEERLKIIMNNCNK